MKSQINYCKECGIEGVVFGILKESEDEIFVDIKRIEELVIIAKPMKITFHMAFDLIAKKIKNEENSLQQKFKAIYELIK